MRPTSASIVILLSCLLAACGGGGGNSGSSQPSPEQVTPTLSAISPSSAVVGSSAVNLELYGSNFENGATVSWNGALLSSTWVSAGQMTATIPTTDIASIGSASVKVVNPGSTGGTSAPQTFSILVAQTSTTWVKSVPGIATAQNIVWDSADGTLYVSLPSIDPSSPNTIVPISPITGNTGPPVPAGNNPDVLSISSDSAYLWVGLDGDNAVQRFLLPGLTKDISFPVPLDSEGNPQQAVSLQAAPVSPHTIALVAGNTQTEPAGNGVYVYDDATQRPAFVPGWSTGGPSIGWIQWGANDSTIYGTEAGIATLDVNSSGVSFATANGGPLVPQGRSQYDANNGLLYSTGSSVSGGTFNPVNGSLVGGFDLPGGTEACTVDSSLGRYYCVVAFIPNGGGDVYNFELWAFDLNSYALLDRVLFGYSAGKPISPITGGPVGLVRWGNAGLALITETAPYVGSGGLFLIDGAAVNPNAAPDSASGANTWVYPWISSLEPAQASAGGENAVVTINGTDFTPTSSACWNCNYLQLQFLPTTYVSSTQLTLTIPANLLAGAANLPISVFDSSSNLFSTNALTFSVMPLPGNTKVTPLDLAGLAMAWDGDNSLLYVAAEDYDGAYPNSIVAINAETGSIVNSQTVSPDPDLLSISSGDQYLYAGFAEATDMTQLQLPALGSPLTWPLTNSSSSATFWAGDLRAAPGSPHTTALTLFNQESIPEETGGVVIYDDSVLRPNYVNGWGGGPAPPALYDTLAWGSSDLLLTGACNVGCLNTPISPFYIFQISPSGAAFVAANPQSFSEGDIHSDFGTGFIYSDDGNVADPNTQAIVGVYNASGLVAPDSSLNRVFILGQTSEQANSSNFTIESFNENTYMPVSSITLDNLLGTPIELIRWGASGLAILTVNPVEVEPWNTGSLGMLYLIEDANFVSNADVAAAHLPKPQDLVLRRWKSISNSKADIVKMVQAGRLQGRP
jgi:hypothetical protein